MKPKSLRVSGLVQTGAISANQPFANLLPAFASDFEKGAEQGKPLLIPVERISPNPYQPRLLFPDKEIEKLAESIKEMGLIQPIAVRKTADAQFQIIAGERRLRACQRLGKASIPALVYDCPDENMALMALSENAGRKDLSDYEIGKAIGAIATLFPSKVRLAEALGMIREDIYRFMAFAALPSPLIERLEANPKLISKSTACAIKQALNGMKPEDLKRAEGILENAANLIETGLLSQTKIAAYIAAALKAEKTARQAACTNETYPIRLAGEPVGVLSIGPNGAVAKIKAGVINSENGAALQRLIEGFIAENTPQADQAPANSVREGTPP